jgi:hypothetical protein
MHLEGAGVDPRGQGEAPALELAAHAKVEVEREPGHREHAREQREAQEPPEFGATQHRRRFYLSNSGKILIPC